MPAATFHGQGQRANRDVGVYIVTVYPNGDRMLMRVEDAVLTIDRDYPDVAWWHGITSATPHLDRVTLEGILGNPVPYTGPLPDEPAAIEPPHRAIGGASAIPIEPSR